MADAIASSGAAVVPYGDAGIGGLLSGLDAACGPGGAPAACSPAQRALQALPWPNEGGAPFDANDARERVFNDDWTTMRDTCTRPGVFDVASERSVTPFLWYEQQDQYEFLNLFDYWAQCAAAQSLPPARRGNNTGIVAVSNVAPAQFEMFASSRIGRGAYELFAPPSSTAPVLVVLPSTAGAAGPDRWAVTGAREGPGAPAGARTALYVLPVTDGRPPPAPPAGAVATLDLRLDAPLVGLSYSRGAAPADGSILLVAATSAGDVRVLTFSPATGALALWASAGGDAGPGGGGGRLDAATALPAGWAVLAVALAATGDASPDSVAVLLLVADGRPTTSGGTAGVNVSFVAAANVSAPLGAGGATVAVQRPLGAPGVAPGARPAIGGGALTLEAGASAGALVAGVVAGAAGDTTFAGVAVWSSPDPTPGLFNTRYELYGAAVSAVLYGGGGGALAAARAGLDGGAPPSRIGFGSHPSLASLPVAPPAPPGAAPLAGTGWAAASGGALVLLLATDSDCDGGLLLNNANFARCALGDPALDASPFYSPFQSAGALATYSLGGLGDFADLVVAPPAPAGAPWSARRALGVCHPSIVHGKLGAAAATLAAALYGPVSVAHVNGTADPATGAEPFGEPAREVAALAAVDGAVVDSLPVLALCGLPNAADGLAWAAWRLPQAPL